ncbi:LOW QUALITY PROTEIN: hypothetical protein HID58_083944, partial [Brassica napus]
TSARSLGHQTSLSVVLRCTCARCERIHSLIGDTRGKHASMGMCLVYSCTLDSDDLEDETLPPWWGLVGVGRNFDGEAGIVCIKGDASAHTSDACAAPQYSALVQAGLHFAFLEALWFHESCGGVYGSGPKNSKRENLGEA